MRSKLFRHFIVSILLIPVAGLSGPVLAQVLMEGKAVAVPVSATVTGQITASSSAHGIKGVSVLAKTVDNKLIAYTFSGKDGFYRLSKLPVNQEFRLFISLHGYRDTTAGTFLKYNVLHVYQKDWILSEEPGTLKEIEISAKKPAFTIRNDTLEFDATAFALLPHSILEDLLRRLPGILIDNNGGITVNGKQATKIEVDGREFFSGNMGIATQNLPAGIVEKIQVSPSRSPEEKFNKMLKPATDQVTINVVLKSDKKIGLLSNALVGYGTKERYAGNGMLSLFNDKSRFGLYGSAGNGNNIQTGGVQTLSSGPAAGMGAVTTISGAAGRNFSTASATSGGGAPASAVPGVNDSKSLAGSFNGQAGNKIKIDATYNLGSQHSLKEKRTERINFQAAGGIRYYENEVGSAGNNSHSLSSTITYTPDSLSTWRFTPGINYGPHSEEKNSDIHSYNTEGSAINSSQIQNSSSGKRQGFSQGLYFGRKSADGKMGMTLNWTLNMNGSKDNLLNRSRSAFFSGSGANLQSNIDQTGNISEHTLGNNINLQLSRSIGNSFVAAFEYKLVQSATWTSKETYNRDPQTSYGIPDSLLSGQSRNANLEQVPSFQLAYRKQRIDLALNAGMRFINQRNFLPLQDSVIVNRQSQFTPKLMFNYRFPNFSSLGISYDISSVAPSAEQLSPIADISNPLLIMIGNPLLKTSLGHNLNFSFNRFIPQKGISLNASSGAALVQNQIVRDVVYDNLGRQVQSFRNVDGARTLRLGGGIQLAYRLKDLSVQPAVNFSVNNKREVGFINKVRNQTIEWQYGGYAGLNINYRTLLSVSPSANISFSRSRYSVNTANNLDYNVQDYSLRLKISPFSRFEFSSQFAFLYNSQIPREFQRSSKLFNTNITYRLLAKEQLSIRLFVNDVFNNAAANRATVSPSFQENMSFNTLRRYFLFALQYRFDGLSARGDGSVPRKGNF
jgi:hypothetical protein